MYADDLSGAGARLFGGRWSSIGKPATYLASSCSLAMLEVLVHLQPLIVPNDYCLVEIDVPVNSVKTVATATLPKSWKDVSPPQILTTTGDDFLRKREYLMLKVPSAIVPTEHNYLLNPLHPDMKKVKIIKKEPFEFDSRLV